MTVITVLDRRVDTYLNQNRISTVDSAAQQASDLNQQTYRHLQTALSLNLRRQLFIAICDDLNLRNRMAIQLHEELAATTPQKRFVSLMLDIEDPNPMSQVATWLQEHSEFAQAGRQDILGFQVLGIERLTRQPAATQRLFLSYLRTIERNLPWLNSSLLLWLTRPWCYTVRQSTPECWNWCTGIFEFASDPVPLLSPLFETTVDTWLQNQEPDQQDIQPVEPEFREQPHSESPLTPITPTEVPLPVNHLTEQAHTTLESTPEIAQDSTAVTDPAVTDESDVVWVVAAEAETEHTAIAPPPLPDPSAIGQSPTAALLDTEVSSENGQLSSSAATYAEVLDTLAADLAVLRQQEQTADPAPNPQNLEQTPPVLNLTATEQDREDLRLLSLDPEPAEDLDLTFNLTLAEPDSASSAPADFTVAAVTPDEQPELFALDPHDLPNLEDIERDAPAEKTPPVTLQTEADNVAVTEHGLASELEQDLAQATPAEFIALFEALLAQHKDTATAQANAQVNDAQVNDATASNPLAKAEVEADTTPAITSGSMIVAESETVADNPTPTESSTTHEAPNQTTAADTLATPTATPERHQPPALPPLQIEQTSVEDLKAQITTLKAQAAVPQTLIEAHLQLGRFCRTRLEQGPHSPALLQEAIGAYEQAIAIARPATDALLPSLIDADILNDLGTLYWMASRLPGDVNQVHSYLAKAVHTYQVGLEQVDEATQTRSYAMLQNNLGTVYSDLAHYQQPQQYLQDAVQCYKAALRHRRPETDAARYAATQNNLGTAYWHLAQHNNPIEHLKLAIAAYNQALRYYQPKREPTSYAMIQNNLGTAYWNLAQQHQQVQAQSAHHPSAQGNADSKGSSSSEAATPREWLLLAINAYRCALRFRTLAAAPLGFATTQNNLGTAYWHLASDSKDNPAAQAEYWQLSIRAYEAALQATRQLLKQLNGQAAHIVLGFDRYATYNNLALAYYRLARTETSEQDPTLVEQSLQAALENHLKALDGWQQQPSLAAIALNCLAQSIRAYYEIWGAEGQAKALSSVPAQLLPDLLPRLSA
ncbi:MAG: hypothetical protein AAGF24_00575 [Cyanobacteria bacterium P01_H01_bin.121]